METYGNAWLICGGFDTANILFCFCRGSDVDATLTDVRLYPTSGNNMLIESHPLIKMFKISSQILYIEPSLGHLQRKTRLTQTQSLHLGQSCHHKYFALLQNFTVLTAMMAGSVTEDKSYLHHANARRQMKQNKCIPYNTRLNNHIPLEVSFISFNLWLWST